LPIFLPRQFTWFATFGELSDLHEENKRIMQRIEKAFGQVEPEAWK